MLILDEDPPLTSNAEAEAAPSGAPRAEAIETARRLKRAGIERVHIDRLQAMAREMRANWTGTIPAPDIVVLGSLRDRRAPAAAVLADQRQRLYGARSHPSAFVHGSCIYLVAGEVPTAREALASLLHEGIGHYGLRQVIGPDLDPLLDDIAERNHLRVWLKARSYGLSYSNAEERRHAAEEVLAELAELAEGGRDATIWERLSAAVATFVRRLVPSVDMLPYSEAELRVHVLQPVLDRIRGRSNKTWSSKLGRRGMREPQLAGVARPLQPDELVHFRRGSEPNPHLAQTDSESRFRRALAEDPARAHASVPAWAARVLAIWSDLDEPRRQALLDGCGARPQPSSEAPTSEDEAAEFAAVPRPVG